MGTDIANSPLTVSTVLPLSWWGQRKARANAVLNYQSIQVDTAIDFNYSNTVPILSGTAAVDTGIDVPFSGVFYHITTTGQLNDLPQSGAFLLKSPKTESWYVARAFSLATPTIAANYCIPLGLDNGGSFIEVALNQPDSTTHFFLDMAAGGATVKADLGATCAIGSALCPVGTTIVNTVALYMDQIAGALVVEFNDVEVSRTLASGGGLDNMPTLALPLDAQSNNAAINLRLFGGFAAVQGPR